MHDLYIMNKIFCVFFYYFKKKTNNRQYVRKEHRTIHNTSVTNSLGFKFLLIKLKSSLKPKILHSPKLL